MARGGYRWAGNPAWKKGKTETIRIPSALKDEVLNLAHALDNDLMVTVNDLPNTDVSQVNGIEETLFSNTLLKVKLQQIQSTINSYKTESKNNPRWDKANKLIADLEGIL